MVSKNNLTPEQQQFYEFLLTRATSSYNAHSELHPSGVLKAGQPFLAGLLYSLHPVNTEELDTMAVDPKGRVYINFDRYMHKGPEDFGGIEHAGFCMNHEPLHLLLNHHKRFMALPESDPKHKMPKNHKYWNYAADLSINQLIDDHRPPNSYLMVGEGNFKHFPADLTTEEYYAMILDDVVANSCSDCGNPLPEDSPQNSQGTESEGNSDSNDSQSSDSTEGTKPGDKESDSSDDPSSAQSQQNDTGAPSSDEDENADGGSNSGNESTDSDDGSEDDTQSPADNGEGEDGDSDGEASSDNGDPSTDGNAGEGSSDGSCKSCGQKPMPDCGSGAGGQARPWELDNDMEGGINEFKLDDIRRTIAEKIKSQPGKHSGSMELWADDYLKPPPYDWKKDLRANVKQGITWKQGKADYQYKRPSRRNQNDSIVLPSLRAPRAKIAIGFDKSYSNLHNLGIVSQNVEQIAKRSGVRGKELLAFGVDTRADKVKFVQNPKEVLKDTKGGGGTDMRVAFKVFETLGKEKKADIAILLTDLETGWPSKPPEHKMKYIVVGIVGRKENNSDVDKARKALDGWATLILVDEAEL